MIIANKDNKRSLRCTQTNYNKNSIKLLCLCNRRRNSHDIMYHLRISYYIICAVELLHVTPTKQVYHFLHVLLHTTARYDMLPSYRLIYMFMVHIDTELIPTVRQNCSEPKLVYDALIKNITHMKSEKSSWKQAF